MDEQKLTDETTGTKLPQLHRIRVGITYTSSAGYVLEFEDKLSVEVCAALLTVIAGQVGEGATMNMTPGANTVGVVAPGPDSDYAVLQALQQHFRPTVPLTGACAIASRPNTYDVAIRVLGWVETDEGTAAYHEFEDKLRLLPGYHTHSTDNLAFVVTFNGRVSSTQDELVAMLEKALGVSLYLERRSPSLWNFLVG